MKIPTEIGTRSFPSKKAALAHYKAILNSYEFGQSLNDNDYDDLLALLNYEYQLDLKDEIQVDKHEESLNNIKESQSDLFIEDVKVSQVQFKTKCFEVLLSDKTSYYPSYIMMINRKGYTAESIFSTACRNCIQSDLVALKQLYFKNNTVQGFIKCQETGILSTWEELAVDHRQPNTLSVIIDRFKEVNTIDVEATEYQTTKSNLIVFKDSDLIQKFILYHRDKATLRVVRKECNSSRTAMARVKKSSKDLTIHSPQLSLF